MITQRLASMFQMYYQYDMTEDLDYRRFLDSWFALERAIRFFDSVNDMGQLDDFHHLRYNQIPNILDELVNRGIFDNDSRINIQNMVWGQREDWYLAFQLLFCKMNEPLNPM